jgi:hypothetical protein
VGERVQQQCPVAKLVTQAGLHGTRRVIEVGHVRGSYTETRRFGSS